MAYWIDALTCVGCDACRKICPAAAVTGERKTPHRIEKESCISCGACARVCPTGSVRDAFGEPGRRLKKTDWPKPVFDAATCMSCGICIEACPVGCLGLPDPGAGGGHLCPVLDQPDACIACGFCSEDCPVDAVALKVPLAVSP